VSRNDQRSGRKAGLKVLYALSLAALCIYVVAGPIVAGTITSSFNGFTSNGDVRSWNYGQTFMSGNTAIWLNDQVRCNGDCVAYFSYELTINELTDTTHILNISLLGYDAVQHTVNDPVLYTSGNELVTLSNAGGDITTEMISWSFNNGVFQSDPLTLTVDGTWFRLSGTRYRSAYVVGGYLSSEVAVTQYVTITDETPPASDTPEPTSASLVVLGFAVTEYLRRKSRE